MCVEIKVLYTTAKLLKSRFVRSEFRLFSWSMHSETVRLLKIYGMNGLLGRKTKKPENWKASGSVDSGRRELQLLDVLVAADEQLVGDEPARAGRVFRVNGRNVHHGVVGGQLFEGEPCIAADADDVAARFERRGRRLVGEERRAVVLGVVVIVGPRDRQPLVLVVLGWCRRR